MEPRKPSLNAYKHGLTGQTLVIEPQDKPAYDQHCKSYVDLYKPVGRPEQVLVEMLANNYWRALRGRSLETALMSRILEHNELLALEPEQEKMLRNIALYLQRIERSIKNNTQALKEMQSERKQLQTPQPVKPQVRTAAAATGFVFSPPEPASPSPHPDTPETAETGPLNTMKAA